MNSDAPCTSSARGASASTEAADTSGAAGIRVTCGVVHTFSSTRDRAQAWARSAYASLTCSHSLKLFF